jgi:hypothetical protein
MNIFLFCRLVGRPLAQAELGGNRRTGSDDLDCMLFFKKLYVCLCLDGSFVDVR